MIVVTGGAGFIGSVLHRELYEAGAETVVVDRLRGDGKWRNLAKHPPGRLLPPEDLPAFLESHPPIEAIVHLGAISDTTATDGDLAWSVNVALSALIWDYCCRRGVRLLYASSAATYGDGAQGFNDALDAAALRRLRPLGLYGWTKHAFDLRAAAAAARGGPCPPTWVGLKFFNVYGPNEYHKGDMVSVVKVKHDELMAGRPARLFRSDRPGVADGAQSRDFIWVGDAVAVIRWLLATPLGTPGVNGLLNVGTGVARSYRDMVAAVAAANGRAPEVEFVDMPQRLRGQYQAMTRAETTRLRAAGYTAPFTTLEDGVARYVRDYLLQPDPYA